jgi:acyl-CoA synthetase (AMP-forming)/AMP-acid ligase II/acyl carrier protein
MLFGFEHVAPSTQPLIGTSFCPFSFDVSVWELFSNLCFGGVLHLIPSEIFIQEAFVSYLADHHINCSYIPPALLSQVATQLEKRGTQVELRRILVGVEPIEQGILQHFRSLSKQMLIVNGYGPTEATICATFFSFLEAKDSKQRTPIGKSVANYKVYIVDSTLQPVPIGVHGELHIAGDGLARGYLNRPELTADKFIPNPFNNDSKARLYKTGDLACYLPDGNIEYLGRMDNQVKIRGFRIELGEIETRLNQDSTVQEAVVVCREDEPGDKRLVAYIVSKLIPERVPINNASCLVEYDNETPITLNTEDISCEGIGLVGVPQTWETGKNVRMQVQLPDISEELYLAGHIAWHQGQRAGIQFVFTTQSTRMQFCQVIGNLCRNHGVMKIIQRTSSKYLRDILRQTLPDYMIPASFVFLKKMPLTPNGKVDRKALPPPDEQRVDLKNSFQAPQTEIEQKIAAIWQTVLHVNPIGIHEKFFDLGGNSLLLVQVQEKLGEELNQELPVLTLFQYPTIKALANYLAKQTPSEQITINKSYARARKEKTTVPKFRQLKEKTTVSKFRKHRAKYAN